MCHELLRQKSKVKVMGPCPEADLSVLVLQKWIEFEVLRQKSKSSAGLFLRWVSSWVLTALPAGKSRELKAPEILSRMVAKGRVNCFNPLCQL